MYAKCIKSCGDPWLKNGRATNFETRPWFRVIRFISLLIFSMSFCFFSYIVGRNAAGCSTKYFVLIFKKGPPQAPLLSVWIVAKKNWFHQSENHLKIDATHFNRNCFSCFCYFSFMFIFKYVSIVLYVFVSYLFTVFYLFVLTSVEIQPLNLRNFDFFHDCCLKNMFKFNVFFPKNIVEKAKPFRIKKKNDFQPFFQIIVEKSRNSSLEFKEILQK